MKLYINLRILILCLALFINSGCSVFMAANQPSKKNLDLISVGTPKAMLITEFGTPIMHENINGEITEIYKFKQGDSVHFKASRMVFHTLATTFSYGIWEIAAIPIEANFFNGDDVAFEVSFDESNKVNRVNFLQEPPPKLFERVFSD